MSRAGTDGPLPAVRREAISVEDLGDEILLYDRESDTAHCLTAAAAIVWRACDEELTLSQLLARDSVDEPTVQRALDELRERRLLEAAGLELQTGGGGISRRQAVGRLAAAATAPLVVSVAAPTAWAACSTINKTNCVGNVDGACAAGYFACGQFSKCVQGGDGTGPCGVGDSGKRNGCKMSGDDPWKLKCCPSCYKCGGPDSGAGTGFCVAPTCPCT